MPCGGVYPVRIIPDDGGIRPATMTPAEKRTCFWCRRPGAGHFYEEWDAYVHAACFLHDLRNHPDGEAAIALIHGHQIYLDTTADQYPVLTPE